MLKVYLKGALVVDPYDHKDGVMLQLPNVDAGFLTFERPPVLRSMEDGKERELTEVETLLFEQHLESFNNVLVGMALAKLIKPQW